MADLISRKAAMDVFMGKPPDFYHTSYIVGEINCLPSVEAVPVVHGHWTHIHIKGKEYGKVYYQHENCAPLLFESPYHYCPHCGAKMDGEQEANDGKAD